MTADAPHEAQPFIRATAHVPLVLLVDDDAEMRAYMRQCLEALPVRIAEAMDGQDALEGIRAGQRDGLALVITDIIMPGIDGLSLKATLQADPRWTWVPVLLITGEAVRARDRPVLRKPFNARRLRTLVQALLDL